MQGTEWRRLGLVVAASLAIFSVNAEAQSPARAEQAREVLGLLDSEPAYVGLLDPDSRHPLVSVQTPSFRDVLVLRPQPTQSPSYQLLVQREDGSYSISRGRSPQTFRGTLAGRPESTVSASLSDEGLFARIILPDGRGLWLEPAGSRLPHARAGEYVLYQDDDVALSGRSCGAVFLSENATSSAVETSADPAPSSSEGTTVKVAELACDADYEYFATYGSVSAVEARIHAVVDAINLQYEAEVGITHLVTTIIVRTSTSQPYLSTDSGALLNELRDEWNTNHGAISRDVTHLFTGKELDGGTIGRAYIGVICNSSYGYGISQSDFNGNFASATDLTAHELGHNWNAGHCTCTSNTMNPYITSANAFSSESISTITAFRDSRSCLEDSTSTPPEPPAPVDPEINLAVGESTATGTLTSGSLYSTHDQDGTSEVLQESSTGGRPRNRRSQLRHTWSFDVSAGGAYTLFLDAHHSGNAEGDDFLFSYSRDNSSFLPMLTVTKTAGDDALQAFVFPEDVSGPLFIQVEDTDRTNGNGTKDSLHVDFMYVHTEMDGTDTSPPSTPTNLLVAAGDGMVSLDWDDNVEPDLAGYNVYRSESSSGPFLLVTAAPIGSSAWTDVAVTNGTTYHYTVSALDFDANESTQTPSVMATPGTVSGSSSSLVSSIVVTSVNAGGGRKHGRAEVWITDELGVPVADALVTGSFSGGLEETLAFLTDAQGLVIFTTTATKKGSLVLTFCVEAVDHATLNYSPALNAETCDVR